MSESKKPLAGKSAKADIDAFIEKLHATPTVRKPGARGRLIFAMDATASRQPTWDHASHIQSEMFAETAALGGLEIQLCYFRGFNEFHAFPWYANSADLLRAMSSVYCAAGHTQIEKVLRHAMRENRLKAVNAVVYVGDCMEENIDRLADPAGQLGLLGIPVFVFQEGNDPVARQAFAEIARLSKGAYCAFDSRSPQQLRDLLGAVAVYASGGRRALENYSKSKGQALRLLTRQLKE